MWIFINENEENLTTYALLLFCTETNLILNKRVTPFPEANCGTTYVLSILETCIMLMNTR
jgi:hypothetical protein